MNDEIKEILDMFTKYKDDWYSFEYKLKPKQCVAVLDYITNLQEENEDYKSRCEKAKEYIMSNLITEWDIKNGGDVSGSDLPADAITPILDIIDGDDEE